MLDRASHTQPLLRVPALAALFVAACQPPPEAGLGDAVPVSAPATMATDPAADAVALAGNAVSTLEGAWRVAGIDGEPFDEPYGLALTATHDLIWWEPRCAGIVRRYRIDGQRITFAPVEAPRAPLTSDGAPVPPRPVCTIGLPTRLRDVTAALDAADTITRTPENGLRIAGGGRSVLLFSQ